MKYIITLETREEERGSIKEVSYKILALSENEAEAKAKLMRIIAKKLLSEADEMDSDGMRSVSVSYIDSLSVVMIVHEDLDWTNLTSFKWVIKTVENTEETP